MADIQENAGENIQIRSDMVVKDNLQLSFVFYSLVGWNWQNVKSQVVIPMFVIASGLAKLGFHKAHWLSSRVPESCLLIILGVAFGGQ